jgi:hypothetical protein
MYRASTRFQMAAGAEIAEPKFRVRARYMESDRSLSRKLLSHTSA